MKKYKAILFLVTLFSSLKSLAQGADQVQMADLLRQDGKIYTVVIGLVIILTAMIILLLKVDRKLFRLEKQQQELK